MPAKNSKKSTENISGYFNQRSNGSVTKFMITFDLAVKAFSHQYQPGFDLSI